VCFTSLFPRLSDNYHNFYVQLYGHKRFLIFPPQEYQKLHPFPFLHPSFGQAQVDIFHTNVSLFEHTPVHGYEAVLHPGYVCVRWLRCSCVRFVCALVLN